MGSLQRAATVALSLGGIAFVGATLTTDAAPPPRPTARSCATVLEADVCTWAVMEGERAVELHASVPLSVIEGVPADAEMVWPPAQMAALALPEEAREALGLDHMGLNWEAHGHPPMHFLTPHFDFHFYNITESQVQAIDCSDVSKPAKLPAGYALPDIDVPGLGVLEGLCVPRMGMHAMAEHETHETALFDASIILGYYGGEPIFFEPMVSRDRLLERRDFELSLPSVEGLPAGVRYPTRLTAVYDAALEEYRFVFTGF